MRNYQHLDSYLTKLSSEIYAQPEGDDQHGALAKKVIDLWFSRLTGCKSVLDVGCGEAFCQPLFESWGVEYEGIALGEDYLVAKEKGRNIKRMDFTFLEYPDENFDLIFSRHSLEHSPMPLLSLMEWRRVSKQWLGLVVPAPDWYGYSGRNHYYVLNNEQWVNLLNCGGWNVLWNETDYLPKIVDDVEVMIPHEIWLFAEKRR